MEFLKNCFNIVYVYVWNLYGYIVNGILCGDFKLGFVLMNLIYVCVDWVMFYREFNKKEN